MGDIAWLSYSFDKLSSLFISFIITNKWFNSVMSRDHSATIRFSRRAENFKSFSTIGTLHRTEQNRTYRLRDISRDRFLKVKYIPLMHLYNANMCLLLGACMCASTRMRVCVCVFFSQCPLLAILYGEIWILLCPKRLNQLTCSNNL